MLLSEINLAESDATWKAAGFAVVDGYVRIGRSFRFKLSGDKDSGAPDYTFADAGRIDSDTFEVNGLKTAITPLPDFIDGQEAAHPNSVVGVMKTVILANNADETSSQLQAKMPELGKPVMSDTSDTGIRYDYWTQLEDSDFEVISKAEDVTNDTIAMVFLFVDDLDVAISAFGEQNVGEKTVYSQRDTVPVEPTSGITFNLRLISSKLVGAE